jgi:hypothetical protein
MEAAVGMGEQNLQAAGVLGPYFLHMLQESSVALLPGEPSLLA